MYPVGVNRCNDSAGSTVQQPNEAITPFLLAQVSGRRREQTYFLQSISLHPSPFAQAP